MSMQISAATSNTAQNSTPRASEAGLGATIPYSTRVGSKTYSADVEQVASEYEGSVPNLFGASTTGSSVGQVEENLTNLISFFA